MRVTGSRLHLLEHCGWWAADDVQPPPGASTTYSAKGTALHALVEHGADFGVPAVATAMDALSESDTDAVHEWFLAWTESEWSRIPWQHEVKFAYDPESDTARVLSSQGSRDYSAVQPGEIAGTADLVYVDAASGVVYVADLKTGFQEHAQPIEEHSQLRFLGLAAARSFMVGSARIQILKLDAIRIRPTEAEIGSDGLDAIASGLRATLARAGSAPAPGSHCNDLYCPALTICPKARETVALVLPKETPAEWATTKPTTPEHALFKRDGAEFLEALAKEWKAEARAYADEIGGIALPDGRIWKRRDETRETIVLGAEAKDILASAGLSGAIKKKESISKESIRREIARREPAITRKEIDARLEDVLAPLRVANTTRNATIPKYTEAKAK